MKSIFFLLIILISVPLYSQPEDIFSFIDQAKNKKVKVKDAYEKGLKWIEKNKDERGRFRKQLERWYFDAQYRIDDDGNLMPPENVQSASVGQWKELGPDSWNRTTGWNPGNGRLTCIDINPLDTNMIIVGSPGGGFWKTINGGASWKPITDNNSVLMFAYSVCFSKHFPGTVYAGLYSSGGIAISRDYGETWVYTNSNLGSPVRKIVEHPTIPGELWATSGQGLHKSTDNGVYFSNRYSSPVGYEDLEFDPSNFSIMYAAGYGSTTQLRSAVIKSVDGGNTWQEINLGTYGRTLIEVSKTNPNYVYVCQANGSVFGRIYRSTDKLQTFDTTITGDYLRGTNFFGYSVTGRSNGGQATYDMTFALQGTDTLIIGGIMLWMSTNQGYNFTCKTDWFLPTSLGYNHADQHALLIRGNTVYTGSDGGLFKSNDWCKTFTDLSKGLNIRQIYRIAGDYDYLAFGSQDNGSTVYVRNQNLFRDYLGADGMAQCKINGRMIGMAQFGNRYYTPDSGKTRFSLPTLWGVTSWIVPMYEQKGVVYNGMWPVYRSFDSGKTNQMIGDTFLIKRTAGASYNFEVNQDKIYYTYSTQLYRGTIQPDNQVTWDSVKNVYGNIWVKSFPNDKNHIILATSSTVVKLIESFDAGRTQKDITYNYPSRPRWVNITKDGRVYSGGNVGVYKLDGTTWTNITGNLPLVANNDGLITEKDGKTHLILATYGRGIWELDITNDTIIAPPPNQPPIANAGSDLTYYIPRNSTTASATITGTGSDDNSGLQLQWKDLTANVTYPSVTNTIYNLLVSKPKGTYQFELTATDAGQLTDKDTMTLTVLDTNTYVQQPSTTVTLSGGKSGKSGVSLNWQTNVTNDTFLRSILYISVNGGLWSQIATSSTLTGSYTNSNLSSGTNYSFRVISQSNNSTGTSNIINLKTGGKPIPMIITSEIIGTKNNK